MFGFLSFVKALIANTLEGQFIIRSTKNADRDTGIHRLDLGNVPFTASVSTVTI